MSQIVRNSFLSSVIGTPRGGRVERSADFRRYKSTCRTSATIGGTEDSRVAQITYEIGRRHNTKAQALARVGDSTIRIEVSYPTSNILSEDFVGLAKKFTNFSASFEFSSLAGVVERLAKTLAAQSVFGEVTSTDIRAGRALTVNALGTYDGPVNSLVNTVFLPRLLNTSITGDVFSVLANAVAGEGSSIATDVVELDATTRQPIIPFVDEGGIFNACVDALRILGSNMIASDQGPLFAYAFTRGLHAVLGVVGHTDEGGITRDLLRGSSFASPFGGVHYGLTPYAGIPACASNNAVDHAAYVDSIALVTAGLVAHCDPGITLNGYWFPTFYDGTAANDPTVRPGQNQEGTQEMANRNQAQWAANIGAFAPLYADALGRAFAAEGQTSLVVSHMVSAAGLLATNNRHLRYPSVTPYFWIEPTSLVPHDFLGSRAEAEGAASFGTRDAVRTREAWEDIVQVGAADTTFTGYHALMRFARTSWFLVHWLNHPANGLGAMPVRQLDPNAIIQPGGHGTHPDIRDRVENSLPLTDYLWVRGQSPFPAPGELINLSGTLGFLVKHMSLDDEGIPTPEHVPTAREFASTEVTIHVGRPNGINNGVSNARDATVRRAKTRASRELAAATSRLRLYGRADVAEMPTLTSAPQMRSRGVPEPEVERSGGGGGVGGWARGATGAGDGIGDAERRRDGEARPAVPQHQAVRYPQVARPGPGGAGGAGQIPPGGPPPPGGRGHDDDDHDDHRPVLPLAPAPALVDNGAAPPNGPAVQ